jgi:hypothetical protein
VNAYQCPQDTPRRLKLSTIEWQQVGYLAVITSVFHNYTLAFSHETEPSLPIVFPIYNSVFNHLESLRKRLEKKQEPWKRDLCGALDAAYAKLSKYYRRTYESEGYLYAMATILSHRQKLKEFQSKEWADECDWFVEYGNIFRKLFHHYAKQSGRSLALGPVRQHKPSLLERTINNTERALNPRRKSSHAAEKSPQAVETSAESDSVADDPEELTDYLKDSMYLSHSNTVISTKV